MLSVYNDCCRRVACDALAIAALVAILVPVIVVNNAGRVVQRGFFCDDESIRLPSKDETVPTWALFLASLGLPTLTVSIILYYIIVSHTLVWHLLAAECAARPWLRISIFRLKSVC